MLWQGNVVCQANNELTSMHVHILVLVDGIARMDRLALHSARGQLGDVLAGGRVAAEIFRTAAEIFGTVCDFKIFGTVCFVKISARTNIILLREPAIKIVENIFLAREITSKYRQCFLTPKYSYLKYTIEGKRETNFLDAGADCALDCARFLFILDSTWRFVSPFL